MTLPSRFTYPFCYVPHPLVVEAAQSVIARIQSDSGLHSIFREGKMLGVLLTDQGPLYAFSGLAGGLATVEGFVPPIFDSSTLRNAESADDSRSLQEWLFRQYRVHNALGEEMDLLEVFALRGIVPPGGTGECAAPKLLEYAYRNGLTPRAMGEFWYGDSPASEVREQGRFYPSCTGKCGPLLTWMMKGLDVDPNPLDAGFDFGTEPHVLHEDESILIVDKPAGILAVPGKVPAPCLLSWLQERYGEVHSCHRLDMDTSGLMVFARSVECKVDIEQQFAAREVSKTYRARLVAPGPAGKGRRDLRKGAKGTIALPLMVDWYDRPRQMVDDADGKPAITEYEVLEVLPSGEVEIRFTPRTGRTHQLRVHAAHARGLARPIKGDRLYGDASDGRLFLHAESLRFRHPRSGETVFFTNFAGDVLPRP